MDSGRLIARLAANVPAIRGLVAVAVPEQISWKPEPKAWSILEVAAHLLDEEREDFRVRLGLVLEDPHADWPPIDPQGWVEARAYADWDLVETIAAWADERAASLRWLRDLKAPRWENAKVHPAAGSLSAGDLLASWAAHDVLHARQLVRLHWAYLRYLTEPCSTDYAGEW